MNDARTTAGVPGVQGLARPLLWSAAGHVLALSACLLLWADRGSGARPLPVVEVLLVADQDGAGWSLPSGMSSAGPAGNSAGRQPSPGAADGPLPGAEERPAAAASVSAPPRGAAHETGSADTAPGLPEKSALVPAAGDSSGPAMPAPAVEAGFAPAAPAPDGALPGPGPASTRGGGQGLGPIAGAGSPPRAEERDGEGGTGAHGLLRARIQSRIVYPEEAVRRRLEGEVLLRIRIETGGAPGEIRVARSSGARILDDAARRGVVRAAPLPVSPGWVEVPVLFRLR